MAANTNPNPDIIVEMEAYEDAYKEIEHFCCKSFRPSPSQPLHYQQNQSLFDFNYENILSRLRRRSEAECDPCAPAAIQKKLTETRASKSSKVKSLL